MEFSISFAHIVWILNRNYYKGKVSRVTFERKFLASRNSVLSWYFTILSLETCVAIRCWKFGLLCRFNCNIHHYLHIDLFPQPCKPPWFGSSSGSGHSGPLNLPLQLTSGPVSPDTGFSFPPPPGWLLSWAQVDSPNKLDRDRLLSSLSSSPPAPAKINLLLLPNLMYLKKESLFQQPIRWISSSD